MFSAVAGPPCPADQTPPPWKADTLAIVDKPYGASGQPQEERIPTIRSNDLASHRDTPTVSARLERVSKLVARQGPRHATPPSR